MIVAPSSSSVRESHVIDKCGLDIYCLAGSLVNRPADVPISFTGDLGTSTTGARQKRLLFLTDSGRVCWDLAIVFAGRQLGEGNIEPERDRI